MRRVLPEVRHLLAKAVKPLDVRDALRIVDDSGVADLLEKEMPKDRGRPRVHAWRSVLALFILAAVRQEHGVHVSYHQKVWWGLDQDARDLLGFTREVANSTMDKYLTDLIEATSETVDLPTGEVIEPRLSMPLVDILNRLLRAAVQGIEESPDQAIDSMPVEAWARRRGWKRDLAPAESTGPVTEYGSTTPTSTTSRRVVSEPGWPKRLSDTDYQPTIDPDVRDTFMGSKNLGPSSIIAGSDLHVMCDVSPLGEQDYPQIPRAFVLTMGNDRKDDALLTLLDSAQRLGSPVKRIFIDRGYTQINNVGKALSERGIDKSLKLKQTQMGPHGTPVTGTVMIDGRLFVDWMPKRLWSLSNYTIHMNEQETLALAASYDERIPYAFEPKGKADDARGVQQYRGPAATGKVRCANHPKTLRSRARVDCPTVAEYEAGKPLSPCACGAQPSLGPDDDLDLRQRYIYGTTKWLADYSRRNSIESSNANFTTQMSSLGERKSVRVITGKAKRNVLTCFGIIAVAVNLVRSRYAKSPSTFAAGEKVSTPLPRPVKRDKEGNIKRTLNALVFSRRKPRRQSGVPRPNAPPGKPAGVPAWAPPPRIKDVAHGEQ